MISDAGFDILDAAVATWADGGALDTILVKRRRRRRRRRRTPTALESRDRRGVRRPARIPPQRRRRPALRRPRVALVHDLRGPKSDRRGLLHNLTAAMASAGANVHSARLVTIDGIAVDRFELTDRNEGKLDDEVKGAVARAVRDGVVPKRRLLSRRR